MLRSVISVTRTIKTKSPKNYFGRQLHSEVQVWGSCDNGQLGLGKKSDDVYSPVVSPFLSGKGVINIVSGSNHAVAITKENTIYSWGDSRYGRLGLGPKTEKENEEYIPKEIQFLRGKNILTIGCGAYHSVACVVDGDSWKTYAWGLNNHGQCGVGDKVDKWIPTEIRELRGAEIKSISCGEDFTIISTSNNEVFSFGRNSEGQLGDGEKTEDRINPQKITSLNNRKIIKVSSGWGHTIAVSADSQVYSWGSNLHGQCGTDSKNSLQSVQSVSQFLPSNISVEDVDCGACLTAFRIRQGSQTGVWLCGSAGDGKLGGLNTTDQLIPSPLSFFSSHQVQLLTCGSDHVITKTDKGLYGWGYGQHGVLGLGKDELKTFNFPQQILDLSKSSRISIFYKIYKLQAALT